MSNDPSPVVDRPPAGVAVTPPTVMVATDENPGKPVPVMLSASPGLSSSGDTAMVAAGILWTAVAVRWAPVPADVAVIVLVDGMGAAAAMVGTLKVVLKPPWALATTLTIPAPVVVVP